jgi:hypothetical protein
MTELSEREAARDEPLGSDAASEIIKTERYALYRLADARNVMLDEMLFAGSEFLDRAVTETQLFNEFLSKLAEAHSLKDLGAMYRECSRHQVEFIRRDAERLLKHSERVIDNTSKLIETWRPN